MSTCPSGKWRWDVYVADALQIPNILIEIGRLGNILRQVGEVPATPATWIHDNHYKHLFLGQNAPNLGAYRMGKRTKSLPATVSRAVQPEYFLFPCRFAVLDRSLEMGRAFIVPEYRRGRWLSVSFGRASASSWPATTIPLPVRHGQHFGDTNLSRALIVSYLKAHEMDPCW
ncbi:MAG: GNAT family N-acetyltransferase [Akkermansia sp.]